MNSVYNDKDYEWVKELLWYPRNLEQTLDFFKDTSEVSIPDDPIEKVIFQDKAKKAIRKIAQNKGHILMVGKPGTGKSMLANMFEEVLDKSLGDYIRPGESIVAYPGKDKNHIRIAYEMPEKIINRIDSLREKIEFTRANMPEFSLSKHINAARNVKRFLLAGAILSLLGGFFFTPALMAAGLLGIGAIFMYIQENNHGVQEKIQQETQPLHQNAFKHIMDMIPEILYDPRRDRSLMARISEPDSRNMKGGFRHDPYQSGNLQTPPHQRAYLGAHAKAPIIYIDELKTLIKIGYMPQLLEIMQNKSYILEGGKDTGSGSADRSENNLKAENIIIACCNHDTLAYLQEEGDGAFLSRIEDKGEIIQMENAVPENPDNIKQIVQYIKQEIKQIGREYRETWGEVISQEGYEGVRKRSEYIFGRTLPGHYKLKEREFSREGTLEIIKELRCRASDGKLSGILRPINGIIKIAEHEAILDNTPLVEARHVQRALKEHLSLEGTLHVEIGKHKRELKKYISSMTDSIGYVVGLAVVYSRYSGQMYGQPLPIHCQINPGGSDGVNASGKIGDIAKAAAQNVRASIKKVLHNIGAPYIGYEMHVEYIQAHNGVEGDSASVAVDIALISDFIQQPVNQKYGVTGSLTGDIILAVGGITEKIRSIMDTDLGMEGACIPWQNKRDIEPLMINATCRYIRKNDIPGIRIHRYNGQDKPFDIYFCKTKYNAYEVLMGINRREVEQRMTDRSKQDLASLNRLKNTASELQNRI